jgi:hypothetical protein
VLGWLVAWLKRLLGLLSCVGSCWLFEMTVTPYCTKITYGDVKNSTKSRTNNFEATTVWHFGRPKPVNMHNQQTTTTITTTAATHTTQRTKPPNYSTAHHVNSKLAEEQKDTEAHARTDQNKYILQAHWPFTT